MIEEKLKIGIITASDPNDKRSWSGISFRMLKSLEEQGFGVEALGPVKVGKRSYWLMNKILITLDRINKYLFNKKYNRSHSYIVSYFHGRYFEKKIKEKEIDVLFAPAASTQIALLRTNIPICYYSDSTVDIMLDYYPKFSGISFFSVKESNQIEQRAINNSKTQVFSSKWALNSAIKNYGSKNPFLVKMGANINSAPPEESIAKIYDSVINIIFIGVDWERKGGTIVLETIEKLDTKGYDVQLTVVGCVPPKKHPKMTVMPFLNKNIEHDMSIFNELLKISHLLFLPTRADCTPIVFCEANAFGIPVISTDTGGVSSIIENDVNGYLLPMSATSTEYLELIENLINDKDKLKRTANSSREKFMNELNWGQWGKEMKKILMLTHASRNVGKVY